MVNQLAGRVAARRRVSKTEAVRVALENRTTPLRERVRPRQERVLSWPSTGLEADKAFYDELSGDP